MSLDFLAKIFGFRLLLSLGMAVSLWTVVTNQENPNRSDWFRGEIPIETKVPPSLVIVGTAGSVRVKIRASQDAWQRAQTNSFKAAVDLSTLGPGLHEVPVSVESSSDYTIVDWTPRKISVRLEPLKAVTVSVKPNLRGNLPAGYQMRPPEITPPQVSASGPETLVESVAGATIDINVDGARTTINQNVQPIGQSSKGGEVIGVSFSPPRVQVVVEIEQQNTFKTVPVKVPVTGQVADGYVVASIGIKPEAMTVVGDPSKLEKVDHLDAPPVDVNGATSDVNRSLEPILPEGVSLQVKQQVSVKITVTPLHGSATTRVALNYLGLAPSLQASAPPGSVEVTVAGTVPLIQSMKPADFTATVDLGNQGPGSYTLPVRVAGPATLSVSKVNPESVVVTLAAPTPAPTAAPAR